LPRSYPGNQPASRPALYEFNLVKPKIDRLGELTLVVVKPDLHIGKLHEKLTWFAEEVFVPHALP
jgi:hypothetical protein